MPLDFRRLAAKHIRLCQHDSSSTDKDSFSGIISFIGHNTYRHIDCPRKLLSKQTIQVVQLQLISVTICVLGRSSAPVAEPTDTR